MVRRFVAANMQTQTNLKWRSVLWSKAKFIFSFFLWVLLGLSHLTIFATANWLCLRMYQKHIPQWNCNHLSWTSLSANLSATRGNYVSVYPVYPAYPVYTSCLCVLSICPVHMSCLYVYRSIFLCVHLSVCLSVCMSICLYVYLCIYIYVSMYLAMYLFIYFHDYLLILSNSI